MKSIKKRVKHIKLGSMLLIAFSISGCSTYSSHFGCPDARGLNCMPVSLVNEQIDSGQIESVAKQRAKCRGSRANRCGVLQQDDMKPELKLEDLR